MALSATYVCPFGDVTAKLWFIFEKGYASDIPRRQILSGAMGSVLKKMLAESGIALKDCFFICRQPDAADDKSVVDIDAIINQYKPPLVIPIGNVAGWFLPELRERGGAIATSKGQLAKYTGSFLKATSLQYNHYCMPLYGPDRFVQDWAERNVTTYVDLQKLKGELKYWKNQGQLQPLPVRTLKYEDMELDEILGYLDRFRSASVLSNDIENPTWNSIQYAPHPGYPFLIGLADSVDFGISFRLFRDNPSENRELWKRLDKLIYDAPVLLGQNFFNYDALFYEMLGFRIRKDRVQDTLIRHHILWPELPHKLQFMTRQYTREPYYKDEGHGWTMKHLNSYRKYNCLDATVTYEVYMGQEEEFNDRPQLR